MYFFRKKPIKTFPDSKLNDASNKMGLFLLSQFYFDLLNFLFTDHRKRTKVPSSQ